MTDAITDPVGDPHVLDAEHVVLRRTEYPHIAQQLNLLYDDVAAGLFGDAAKQGTWFTAIQAVKQKYPKDCNK